MAKRFSEALPIAGAVGPASRRALPKASRTTPMRPLLLALPVALLAASCGSTSGTRAQAPVAPETTPSDAQYAGTAEEYAAGTEEFTAADEAPEADSLAPAPWTGAFSETAVMLAGTIYVEGPQGLLDHVAARVDDAYYERATETTEQGFLQTIVRPSEDVPEIRVRLDRWTMAAISRVVILERFDECSVTVVASGDAIWRDVDGTLARSPRLEFVGHIGQDEPVAPVGATRPTDGNDEQEGAGTDEVTEPEGEQPEAGTDGDAQDGDADQG